MIDKKDIPPEFYHVNDKYNALILKYNTLVDEVGDFSKQVLEPGEAIDSYLQTWAGLEKQKIPLNLSQIQKDKIQTVVKDASMLQIRMMQIMKKLKTDNGKALNQYMTECTLRIIKNVKDVNIWKSEIDKLESRLKEYSQQYDTMKKELSELSIVLQGVKEGFKQILD
jgi:DNA repair exonuclease SbcCD ATPase subunit